MERNTENTEYGYRIQKYSQNIYSYSEKGGWQEGVAGHFPFTLNQKRQLLQNLSLWWQDLQTHPNQG